LITENKIKSTVEKKNYKNCYPNLLFTHPEASIKAVQATKEAFSPQKRTSSSSKSEISSFFQFLWVIFALLYPDTDPVT
jgi:hypothetical protein